MTYEEFKNSTALSKIKAVYRLTGRDILDLDAYLRYILNEGIPYDITEIKALMEDNQSDILKVRHDGIRFKTWGTALKYPEFSIFVTNMAFLFCNYPDAELDVSKLDTSNVEDMTCMFRNCNKLKNLDLSNFNTSKVTDMSNLFWNCCKLTKIDMLKFDTSKVECMLGMFKYCEQLESVSLGSFDTSNVKIMSEMFGYCENLTDLDLSNFDICKVDDMTRMFCKCKSLKSLNLSSFHAIEQKYTQEMFKNCSAELNLIAEDSLQRIYRASI